MNQPCLQALPYWLPHNQLVIRLRVELRQEPSAQVQSMKQEMFLTAATK